MWSYKRKGKGRSQVAVYHMYVRAAGMDDGEKRQLLFEETGFRTSKAPQLTQGDFDRVMIRLERRLRHMLEEGLIEEADLDRQRINPRLDYWEARNPVGQINTRQREAVLEAWCKLRPLLPEDCRHTSWLLGFVERATGASDLWTATAVEAGHILDGLRQRIRQERRRIHHEATKGTKEGGEGKAGVA